MKTVLITGATGAIGSALVPLFLDEPDTEVCVLLRADSAPHVEQRLNQLRGFWEVEVDDPRNCRLRGLRGDVCVANLGLPEDIYDKLAAEVTHVIHAAGNVKLNQTLAEARRSALDGTRHVAAFAQACRRGGQGFQKLDVVSTVGVAGRMRGLVLEAPMPFPHVFHNTYEAAKAEAEHWLLAEIGQGLPATIHRPSMVVGAAQTGKIIHFQVFYYLSEFLSGARTWGFVPRTGTVKLDIIPADYVARVIHRSSAAPDTIGRIFHLCSGPQYALTLAEMTQHLRDFFHDHGRRLPPLRRLPASWFGAFLPFLGGVLPPQSRRAFQGLPFFLAYLNGAQEFDNTHTQAYFGARGLDLPHPTDYLPTVLGYYWAKKYETPPARPSAVRLAT